MKCGPLRATLDDVHTNVHVGTYMCNMYYDLTRLRPDRFDQLRFTRQTRGYGHVPDPYIEGRIVCK